jgi:hypothetical protein
MPLLGLNIDVLCGPLTLLHRKILPVHRRSQTQSSDVRWQWIGWQQWNVVALDEVY